MLNLYKTTNAYITIFKGGIRKNKLSDGVLRYNGTFNKWFYAGQMNTPRHGYSVARVTDTSKSCPNFVDLECEVTISCYFSFICQQHYFIKGKPENALCCPRCATYPMCPKICHHPVKL